MRNLTFIKLIDIPPLWLLGALIASYWIGRFEPAWLRLGGAPAQFLGGLLVGGGVLLMLLAITEMRRLRTTVIPHLEASQLVTSGIFSRSRNPIYLGDVLILTGLILRWEAVLALPLVIVFVSILKRRFIFPEEHRLYRQFGAAFSRYCQKVRRWA